MLDIYFVNDATNLMHPFHKIEYWECKFFCIRYNFNHNYFNQLLTKEKVKVVMAAAAMINNCKYRWYFNATILL